MQLHEPGSNLSYPAGLIFPRLGCRHQCRKNAGTFYTSFSNRFSPSHWPRHPRPSTRAHCRNGVHGASSSDSRSGCQKTHEDIRTSSPSLPRIAGVMAGERRGWEMLPQPCSRKSATLRGIIGEHSATTSGSCPVINSQSQGCSDPTHPASSSLQLQPRSSNNCTSSSISQMPDTMWSRIFPEASSSCSSLTMIGWTMSASSRRSVTCGCLWNDLGDGRACVSCGWAW
jgi:hypothetical protein